MTLFANYKLKLINLQSDSRATEHNEKFGVNNGEREERAIMLVWGRAPSSIQGPGQKGQGQSPLKLKGFSFWTSGSGKFALFSVLCSIECIPSIVHFNFFVLEVKLQLSFFSSAPAPE